MNSLLILLMLVVGYSTGTDVVVSPFSRIYLGLSLNLILMTMMMNLLIFCFGVMMMIVMLTGGNLLISSVNCSMMMLIVVVCVGIHCFLCMVL